MGEVDPIPLRECTTLNVNGIGLRRLVDLVRSERASHTPDGCPRTSALGFWTVSSHYLPRKVAILIIHDDPFDTRTPRVVLYAVFGLVVHRLQYPSAYDLFFEGLLLAECIAGTKGNSEARNAKVVIVSVVCRFIVFIVSSCGFTMVYKSICRARVSALTKKSVKFSLIR